jgi:hypothetical protein
MKKLWIGLFGLALCAAMLGFTGCGGGGSDGGGGEDEVIVARGTKESLRVGSIEKVVNIADLGAGTLSAEISWNIPPGGANRRIRGVLTIKGSGRNLADLTSLNSPFRISTLVKAGDIHILYLGNPDGPDVIDVDYTVFFVPEATP